MTAPPLDTLSDRELVGRYVRRRDEPAFAALVRRHGPLVLGVCQRVLGHRQDVEDAFQATFLVLARDAHRVKKRDSLSSWLHGVAYRTSLRAAEGRHRRFRLLKDVTMIEDSSLADVAHRHERQLLDEELHALPERFRAPLVLHYLESKTAKQVADELKLTVSTVEGRLKRGRKELQLRLARRGVGLSVALAALPLTPSVVTAAELESLVGHTIHAGLSYTAGDPAGPLYTHEAARLAAQETIAMTTTTTATLTALLLVPVALAVSNHGAGPPSSGHATQIATGVEQALAQSVTFATTEIAQATDDAIEGDVHEVREVSGQARKPTPEELRILEVLRRQVSVNFNSATLAEVMEYFVSKFGINVVLDEAGIRQAGVSTETPISMVVDDIQLRSALNLILKPLNLGYTVEDEVLKVTSISRLANQREKPGETIIEYFVRDGELYIRITEGSNSVTISESKLKKFFPDLELQRTDEPDKSPKSDAGHAQSVIREREQRFLDTAKSTHASPAWHFKEHSKNVERIEAALEQDTSVEFVDTPLSEAIQFISNAHHITILIDEPELVDVGLATDEPVNLIISDIKLESAFYLMLEPLGLDYLIQHDVLTITTSEKADNTLETRVYDLRWLPPSTAGSMADLLFKSTSGPWGAKGGKDGTATPIDGGLVVRQTQRMHREIVQLLEQLRRHAEAK